MKLFLKYKKRFESMRNYFQKFYQFLQRDYFDKNKQHQKLKYLEMHLLSKYIVGISIKKSKTSYNLINLLKTEFFNSEDEINSTRTELF